MGLLSITKPSRETWAPLISNKYISYEFSEEDYPIGTPKSEASTFAWHNQTFFLKKQNDKAIELTYNCGYD